MKSDPNQSTIKTDNTAYNELSRLKLKIIAKSEECSKYLSAMKKTSRDLK